jgi:biotin-(acetyl-CoA carboxylase) ligase
VQHSLSRGWVVSTPYEMFRATLPAFTPDGEQATVIITRQGQGSAGRVWITFSGAWVTTAVMTDEQAERLERLVRDARRVRR